MVESSLTSALVDMSLRPDSELLGDLVQSFHRIRFVESKSFVLSLAPLSGKVLSWFAVRSKLWVRVGSTVG